MEKKILHLFRHTLHKNENREGTQQWGGAQCLRRFSRIKVHHLLIRAAGGINMPKSVNQGVIPTAGVCNLVLVKHNENEHVPLVLSNMQFLTGRIITGVH